MGEFAIGQSPGRLEDLRLPRAKGRFVEVAAELIEIDYQAPPAVVEGIDALGGDAPRRGTAATPARSRSTPIPAATNPLGVKGAGEVGTVGALPAVMNGIIDALSPHGIDHLDMPASPERIWRAIRAAS